MTIPWTNLLTLWKKNKYTFQIIIYIFKQMFNRKKLIMEKILLSGVLLLSLFAVTCNKNQKETGKFDKEQKKNNVVYAGARSSSYGIKPFPQPEKWVTGMRKINNYFKAGSTPSALWIVGVMGNKRKNCRLEFPVDTGKYQNISCMDYDKHEKYLSHFDTTGVKVYLQVESAMANVDTLIKLVLDRYSHHPSVIGFGVDAEWYRWSEEDDWGQKINDSSARRWEKHIKSYNNTYQMFLKHWDRKWMPENYRGEIIFVSDSQMFEDKEHMITEFTNYWGEYFYPNKVFYQIGYPKDRKYWNTLDNPVKEWGVTLANNHKQDIGIFWVDFTLQETLPVLKKAKK